MAAANTNNGVVPDCQPNRSPDESNLKDVRLDEEDEPSDTDTTTIPTRAPTSSHGDLSFLQDKFLLDDDNCRKAENAYNNKDTTNATLLLTQKVIQLLIDANQKKVTAIEFRTRQEEIEQDWQDILASTSFEGRANICDPITKLTRLIVLLHWATPDCMEKKGANKIDIKQAIIRTIKRSFPSSLNNEAEIWISQ